MREAPHHTARIDPDRRGAGILAILLVVVVMGASMAFSFKSLRDTAEWTPAPEWARTMAPLYIDGAILAFTVALALFRWRRHDKYARSAKRWLYFSTIASMLLNGLHTAAFHFWNFASLETYGGIIIASGAPLFALVSAEQIIRLVFQQPEVDEVSDTATQVVADEPAAPPPAFPSGLAEAAEYDSKDRDDGEAPAADTDPEPAYEVEQPTAVENVDAVASDVSSVVELPEATPMLVDHEGRFILPPVDVPGPVQVMDQPSNMTPMHPQQTPESQAPMSISYS